MSALLTVSGDFIMIIFQMFTFSFRNEYCAKCPRNT